MENKKSFFDEKIKPKLMYVGTLGAVLMSIAYIVCVVVMIFGFKVKSIEQSIMFASVNGAVGLIIMQLLKVQGEDFAKSLDENKKILEEYNATKIKAGHKPRSMRYFWVTSLINDVLTKMIAIILASAGIIYIVIEGNNDYSLLLIAVVNLIMFICFGFLSLCRAYDFYNNEHIPYLKNIIDKRSEQNVCDRQENIQEP